MDSEWKSNFKSYALRTNFHLGLTRPQMEFLCAVADDVTWDRFRFGGVHAPDNFIGSEGALTKRGLIERKKNRANWTGKKICEITSCCELTEVGWHVVELLKIAGLFIESDNAIERKARPKSVSIRRAK